MTQNKTERNQTKPHETKAKIEKKPNIEIKGNESRQKSPLICLVYKYIQCKNKMCIEVL